MPQPNDFHSSQLSEKQFQALIENAHEGIVLYDDKGRIKYASQSVVKVVGYKSVLLIGKHGIDFIHPDDVEEARVLFRSLRSRPGKSLTFIQRVKHKTRKYIWCESRLTNFMHVPEIQGIVSNFRDITEKKLAEEKAKETQELLETINRNLTEGVFMGILGKKFLHVNEAFLKITGFHSLKDLEKFNPAKLFKDKKQHEVIIRDLKSNVTLKNVEAVFKRKNGSSFWGFLNISLLNNEGKSDYFVGTLRDISREKEAERQLIESRNFLKNVINTVAAPIFVKDEQHRLVMFNRRFTEYLGKKETAIANKSDKDLFPREEVKAFWKVDNNVLRTGQTIVTEEKITTPAGVKDSLTVKSRYINEKGEKFIIGFIADITDLKKTEEKLKLLHNNLDGILRSSEESIFAVDNNLCYTAFNPQHKKIMKILYGAGISIGGQKLAYVKGSPDARWIKAELVKALQGNQFTSSHYQKHSRYEGYIQCTYNPIRNEKNEIKGVAVFIQDVTDRIRFEEIIKSINANLRAVMESTTDGILALDRNLRYITFNQAHAKSIKALYGKDIRTGDRLADVLPPELFAIAKEGHQRALKGKPFTLETKIEKQIVYETSYNPIHDDHGQITGTALFIRDITSRKQLEEQLKALNAELANQNLNLAAHEKELKTALKELSERNFELDQLMYKTSHDLRSPLSSIMGLINLANIDPDPTNYKDYLAKIEGRIMKLDDFIRSMLNYARVNRVELKPERIDLQALIQTRIQELEYLENFRKMRTVINVKNRTVPFMSDRLRIEIIFGNIISNAYKYYNPEVKSYLNIQAAIGKKELKVTIRDNGIGIKEEHMNKIFNMFYRATDRSQGSGLGMYIVKQAVEKLNGKIAIQSTYGKGTTLQITIPNAL